MKCNACGEKEASVHLTQMVNEDIKKIHLCDDCAAASGLDMNAHMSFADAFLEMGGQESRGRSTPDKTCPVCQMHFADFKKTLRLGCPRCYDAFERELLPLIEKMHKGKEHVGKLPVGMAPKHFALQTLPDLDDALKEAIASENYEEAARIRDRIHGRKDKKPS